MVRLLDSARMTTADLEARSLLLDGRPFSIREAERAGLSRHRLGELVRLGSVVQPFHGVYLDALQPRDQACRVACLTRVLPVGAVVCRRTAAWLSGIDTCGPGENPELVPLECAVATRRVPLRHPGLLSYATPLAEADVTELGGVPVTTLTRTAVDLARWLEPHMGLAVVDAMLGRRLVEQSQLVAHVERFSGGRRVGRARRTIALADPRSESYGESWLRLRVIDAGFPAPEPQVVVTDAAGAFIARVDLADRRRRLAVEYDGQEHHTSAEDCRHDDRRRHSLHRVGWRVIVATGNEVLGRSMRLEEALGEAYSMPVMQRRRLW